MDNATSLALELLNLQNKGYKALFLQGGASMQFLMTAYNLLENKAGYINTGAWSTKALKEAKNFGDAIEVATSEEANFNYIPKIILMIQTLIIYISQRTIQFLEHNFIRFQKHLQI